MSTLEAVHLLLSAEESEPFLLEELRRSYPGDHHESRGPRLLETDLVLQPEALPTFSFLRQFLPHAVEHAAASIAAWADLLLALVLPKLVDQQPWRLHIVSHYGVSTAGQNRCRLIREAIQNHLRRKRRQLLRGLEPDTTVLTPAHSVVQLLLTGPERGYVSVVPAPWPFQLRRLLSPFPKGELSVAADKSAPSRAFAKLVEAEMRLGRRIAAEESCVDLGASPGSWSYLALQRGARVMAVDRAALRSDLMSSPRLRFERGDAFTFQPEGPVDWLLCDVIAAPQRSVALVLDWVRHRRMRHFVVTIKFKGHHEYHALEPLKEALPRLCEEFHLTRLCTNKNEVCAFGTVRAGGSSVNTYSA